jgi:bifunctional DNase/RNase
MRVFAVVQPLLGSLEIALIDPADSVVFPLYVVPCQGAAVHAGLHGLDLPEAQPYELLRRLLERGQAQMTHATVTRLEGSIFIGEIGLARSGRSLAIDARPSDAIALAQRVGAPVYVARALLEQHGEDPAPYRQLLGQPAPGL